MTIPEGSQKAYRYSTSRHGNVGLTVGISDLKGIFFNLNKCMILSLSENECSGVLNQLRDYHSSIFKQPLQNIIIINVFGNAFPSSELREFYVIYPINHQAVLHLELLCEEIGALDNMCCLTTKMSCILLCCITSTIQK